MDGLHVLEVVTKAKERVQGNVIILHQQIKVLHVKVHQKRKNCVSCRDVTLVSCGLFYRSCVVNFLPNGPIALWAKFWKSLNRKTYYHSIEEHLKISKIAKFGCETL